MKCFFRVFIKVLVLTFLITNIAQADRLALPAVTDMTAPVVVQSNYATNIDAGEDHQILVTVTDNIAIKSVILFHRDMGSNEYQTKTMRNIVGTDDYATTISADQLNIDGIEYYIQATDSFFLVPTLCVGMYTVGTCEVAYGFPRRTVGTRGAGGNAVRAQHRH